MSFRGFSRLMGVGMDWEGGASNVIIGTPRATAEIWEMRERLAAMPRDRRAGDVVCDVSRIREPDCETVDALARLQLTARRRDRRVRLRGASRELQELLTLCGLNEFVPWEGGSGLEAVGKAEEGEESLGVEEEGDAADAAG